MQKRIFSCCLTLCLIFTLLPSIGVTVISESESIANEDDKVTISPESGDIELYAPITFTSPKAGCEIVYLFSRDSWTPPYSQLAGIWEKIFDKNNPPHYWFILFTIPSRRAT